MSLSSILKLIGWITLLLFVIIPKQPSAAIKLQLTTQTKEYINGLYANPFIHNLINNPQYRDRYLEVLFQHFRADFQNWDHSHWPTVLQDLELLPAVYCNPRDARQDHRLMRDLWEQKRDHLQPEPIEDYHQTMLRVPPDMDNVLKHDTTHYHRQTRSVLYEFLVREMQSFVDGYPVSYMKSKREWRRKRMAGKVLRFKAFYWLTVLDRFIGTVQLANAQDGVLLASPFPRTVLRRVRQNPVAQQTDPMLNPLAQAGPSGFNPVLRAPSATAGAPSRGTKRKATRQGGGPSQGGRKRGPGGAMRSMDGASNEPQVGQVAQAQQSNSGGSSTALSWVSVSMMTIAVSLVSFA